MAALSILFKLPNEILLEVAEHSEALDLLSFSKTCRWVHSVVELVYWRKAVEEFPYLLPWACETRQAGMVEKMLVAGANPNIPHRLRQTPYNHATVYFSSWARPNWYRDLSKGLTSCVCLSTISQDPFRLLELVYGPTQSVYANTTHYGDKDSSFFDGISDDLAGLYTDDWDMGYEYVDNLTTMRLDPRLAYDPQNPLDYPSAGSYWFPLHAAAKAGCNEIVELLVNHGSHLDLPSKDFCHSQQQRSFHRVGRGSCIWTPLHTALWYRNESTANLLISLGASQSVGLHDPQSTVLHSAASRGCLSTLQYLIDTKVPFNVNARDRFGRPPLGYACEGSFSCVKNVDLRTSRWLVNHGADSNVSFDNNNYTVLHAACYEGRFRDAIRYIESGANIHAVWKMDCSIPLRPLGIACLRGPYEKLERGEDLSGDDIEEDRIALVERLIKEGAALEFPEPETGPSFFHSRYQPLIAASISLLLPVMKLLVAAGASVRPNKRSGLYPLLGALFSSGYHCVPSSIRDDLQWDTVVWLLDHGADPNQKSRMSKAGPKVLSGPPLLFLCRETGYGDSHRMRLIELLLARGANPNLREKGTRGWTPLMAAIYYEHYDVARCLLQNGAAKLQSYDVLHLVVHMVTNDNQMKSDDELQARQKSLRLQLKFILEVDKDETLIKNTKILRIAMKAHHSPLAEILMDMGAALPWKEISLGYLCNTRTEAGQRTTALAERFICSGVTKGAQQCLEAAIISRNWDLLKLIIHFGFPVNDLRLNVNLLRYLLWNLQSTNCPRATAESDDMIVRLLSMGCVDFKPEDYTDYLKFACEAFLPRTITALVNAGNDPYAKDRWGQTPLLFFLRAYSRVVSPVIKPKEFVNVLKVLIPSEEDLEEIDLEELQVLVEMERLGEPKNKTKLAIEYEFTRHFMAGIDPESSKLRLLRRPVDKM